MNRVFKIVLLVLLLIMGSGCTKEETYKIGFVGTLTGKYSVIGVSELYGAQLAVDEINAAGGINGRFVELIIKDDEGDPDKAVKVDNELLEMGVDIIIGHSISIVAIETVENANAKDLLLVSPSVGTDSLTGLDDNFIRNISTTLYEGYSMAAGVLKQRAENVLLVYNLDNYVLTHYHVIGIEEHFAQNGYSSFKTLAFESDNDLDIDAIESELISGEYDTLIITSSHVDAGGFVNFVKTNDLDINVHLGSWAATGILDRIDTVDTENIYSYFSYVERNDDADFVRVKEAFELTYGQKLDMVAANSYDCLYMLKEAIERAESFENDEVKAAIIAISTFDGISGAYSINEYGDSVREHYMMRFEKGETILVE